MGGLLIGILATLIQIGVMVGIVVLIVKAVGGRDKTSTESVGVVIRRVFVYLIMLSMLILVAIGLGGLIDAGLPTSGEITDSSADAARSIAFVIVGLPVFVGLALYTARRLRADPREQRSTGWAFYLTIALLGSLLVTMALVGAALSEIAGGEAPDRTSVINAVIWAGVWVAHWSALQRFPPRGAQVHLLAGSAIGLIWAFTGAIATVTAVTSTIYDGIFLDSITGGTLSDLIRPAMILIVGLPVWWWYWLRHSRADERTSLWNAYTLLLGVLGGLISAVTGAGIILFSVLEWFLGDVSESAAAHFAIVPGALAGILVGGAVWTYHARAIGGREDRARDEVDRVYDYLVSAAGLIVAASGVATLIATALKGMSSRGAVATGAGDILPTALTLLIIGVPLWWRYWSSVQQYRRTDPDDELPSITRRIYILGLFGVAAVVAVISLIVIVFIVVEDALDGVLGSTTVNDSAVAFSLLVTAGALALYHLAVFREDRDELPPDVPVVEEEPPDDGLVLPGSLEAAVLDLVAAGQTTVIVTRTDDGYRLAPSKPPESK